MKSVLKLLSRLQGEGPALRLTLRKAVPHERIIPCGIAARLPGQIVTKFIQRADCHEKALLPLTGKHAGRPLYVDLPLKLPGRCPEPFKDGHAAVFETPCCSSVLSAGQLRRDSAVPCSVCLRIPFASQIITDLLYDAEKFSLHFLPGIDLQEPAAERRDQKSDQAELFVKYCVPKALVPSGGSPFEDIRNPVYGPIAIPEFIVDRKGFHDLRILDKAGDELPADRQREGFIDTQRV